VAEPSRHPARPAEPEAADDAPPHDPTAVERAYAAHRARRRAQLRQARARRYARVRFFVVIAVLLGLCIYLTLTVWQEIERLFGL
jgi:cell division septal protein FtsQ